MQQYTRRDCIEIIGVPKSSGEDVMEIVTEVSNLVGVQLTDEDISTAHRLPDTKRVKDRIIAKLVRREDKDKIYSNRRKLSSKSTKDIPTLSSWITKPSKIHINESLTPYRRRLFGKVNNYRRENNFKFVWTVNGKIYLRQSENSPSYSFTTENEFDQFLSA